jgi:hypothetical protein
VLGKRRFWADCITNIAWRGRLRSRANISGPQACPTRWCNVTAPAPESRNAIAHSSAGAPDGDFARGGADEPGTSLSRVSDLRSYPRVTQESVPSSCPNQAFRAHSVPVCDRISLCVSERVSVSDWPSLPWHGRGRRFEPVQVHQIHQLFTIGPLFSITRKSRTIPDLEMF